MDIHAPMFLAGPTYCAEKNVLKSFLIHNAQWCGPTVLFGVWEKVATLFVIKISLFSLQIMEKMLDRGKDIKGLKKKISKQAKQTGLKYHTEGEKEGLFKVFIKM